MFNVDETRGGVTEDHGTAELISVGLTTGSMEEASLDLRFKVVAENTVTWEEHISFEVANSVWVLGSGSGVIRGVGLFSILTGGTGRVAVASAPSQAKGNFV
jgi:uncharacterized protein (AIM24 family)